MKPPTADSPEPQHPALAAPTDHMRLPPDVQRQLLAAARPRLLDRGEALFLKGSMPDALFGVTRGVLRVSVAAPNGREAVITVLEPGHWFGEVSLLVGHQRVYDTVALEPSEVAVVAAQDFHRLVATQPEIHMAFTRLVCWRLRQALSWIDDAILMPLPVRLARRLLALTPRGAPLQPCATVAVSQEDLAFMLGVSRQSVNRQLKAWEGAGWLRVAYRSIELLSHAELAREAAVTP